MRDPHARDPARLPAGVWVLGGVSLLMDVSSEMIHSLLPLFMVTVLGTSTLAVGLIEGAAEATALMVKVFSGVLSDYFGRRKPLAVAGYALGALSKPLFALATGTGAVVAARLIDRVGKGVRGAPRDALVADIVPARLRGAAFGLRQSLDTVGAFLGPLLAFALMLLWSGDFRAVFWVAVLPGVLAVVLLVLGVREPAAPVPAARRTNPISRAALGRLSRAYWWVVGIGAVFTLARFSEAFLILKATAEGLPLWLAPLVLVVMSLVYALGAYPAGILSDRLAARWLLLAGLAALLLADLVLALGSGLGTTWVGIALWGLHMALTQGLLSKMVADTVKPQLRGSAFGLFGVATGLAMLGASALAGLLWTLVGPDATFLAGAGFSTAAAAILLVVRAGRPN